MAQIRVLSTCRILSLGEGGAVQSVVKGRLEAYPSYDLRSSEIDFDDLRGKTVA